MTNEKKKTIVLTVILAVVALILIGVLTFMELRKSGTIGSIESSGIIKEFNEQFNSKERTIIYFSSSQCGYCSMQTPILEAIAADYDLDYYTIDSTELSNTQRKEITEKLGIEGATPTTVIVEKGEIIDVQVGYVDGNSYVDFLIKNEILEEDAVYSAEANITFIDYEQYKDLLDKRSKTVVVVGQASCGNCTAFKPAMNAVAKDNDIVINYIDLASLTEEENNGLFQSLKDIGFSTPDFDSEGSFRTPLTLVIENKKAIRFFEGQKTISQLTRELEKAGVIK